VFEETLCKSLVENGGFEVLAAVKVKGKGKVEEPLACSLLC
jgi:hypothetical protein